MFPPWVITRNVFKAITLLVKIVSYMLDISTTNYTCTLFKTVGFTVQTMEFMFMKWVNEKSGAEIAPVSVPLNSNVLTHEVFRPA